MIKNERQYRITKTQLDAFERAAAELPTTVSAHTPLSIRTAQFEAVNTQLSELRAQLLEYEALRSGSYHSFEINSFNELPLALIRARIASGLSQKQLAERLGLKEQQIQQYESSNYIAASFDRLRQVVDALALQMHDEVFLPGANISKHRFFDRLAGTGADQHSILSRILPPAMLARLRDSTNTGEGPLVLQAASLVGRVFGWRPSTFFSDIPLRIDYSLLGTVRFKLPSTTTPLRVAAYTVYVHYLGLLALDVTHHIPVKTLPASALAVRADILHTYGALTFENALKYVWSLGIPVLPLSDPAAFHGACWRVDGRNILVLKQRTLAPARWLHDLMHELFHALQDPDERERAVIERDDILQLQQEQPEEIGAQNFAEDVIFGGRADEIAEKCAARSAGNLARLKSVVPRIAAEESVPADSLAYHLAFRLSREGEDWWGTASNLQNWSIDPCALSRTYFLTQANLQGINDIDRRILLQAFQGEDTQQ